MNLSLKRRLVLGFILATLSVVITTVMTFVHLSKLDSTINKMIEDNLYHQKVISELEDNFIRLGEMRVEFLTRGIFPDKDQLILLGSSLISKLEILKEENSKNLSFLEFLNVSIERIKLFEEAMLSRSRNAVMQNGILLLESFRELQKLGQEDTSTSPLKDLVNQNSKRMLLVLTISFFICILLCLIIPTKVAFPFRKLREAIKELQECNFEVSIFYNKDDEVGELANDINRMILSLKQFEELRAERILLENRKFDALANMTDLYVIAAKSDEKCIYLNNRCYSLLQIQSEDVIGKSLAEGMLPIAIIDLFKLAIKRRSKIENEIVSFTVKGEGIEDSFDGIASVIPIRSKDSSNDYYLMMISKS